MYPDTPDSPSSMSNSLPIATIVEEPPTPLASSSGTGWGPPRTPIAPHRLAKLANALGVSTPIPALSPHSPIQLFPSASLFSEHPRRPPTPRTGFTSHYGSPTSKFLLHIIPPHHLSYGPDSHKGSEPVPPPPTASGYHVHFRRGTLLPVHPTLQSQLGAIAKEYALPSTTGMVLYLVSSNNPPSSSHSNESETDSDLNSLEEPGPRLSEDIWKHLWARVVRAEQDDTSTVPSQSSSPHMFALNIGIASRSSPYLPHDRLAHPLSSSPSPDLSRLTDIRHPVPIAYPPTPVSSTPSFASSIPPRTKSAPTSSPSVSHSESDTPETSPLSPSDSKGALEADGLDLPGLRYPSFIPILAKVEFDIDRRKAGWYEPWLASRRTNHAKRADSRGPLDLKLVDKKKSDESRSLFSKERGPDADDSGYEQLSDGNDASVSSADEDDGDFEEASIQEASFATRGDPLADVFGTDAETWSEVCDGSRPRKRPANGNVVDLALTGSDLAAMPENGFDTDDDGSNDEDEVQDIMDRVSQSRSSGNPNSIPRASGMFKKGAPPPLQLHVLTQSPPSDDSDIESSVQSRASDDTKLPYLKKDSRKLGSRSGDLSPGGMNGHDPSLISPRSPMIKREGAFFDELDLGLKLDQDEYLSQEIMKTQLDQIEQTLVEYSPQPLQNDQATGQSRSERVRTPSTPGLSLGKNSRSSSTDSAREPGSSTPRQPAAMPAFISSQGTPVAHPSQTVSKNPFHTSRPRLASTGEKPQGLKPTVPKIAPSDPEIDDQGNEDSEVNRHDLLTPTASRNGSHVSSIIPLSPDPFGRFSSTPQAASSSSSRQSMNWPMPPTEPSRPLKSGENDKANARDSVTSMSGANSSRFSADSSTADETAPIRNSKGQSLITVKSIKNIWRKSSKQAVGTPQSSTPPPPVPPTLPSTSSPPQMTPKLSPPATSTFPRMSTQPGSFPPGATVNEQLAALVPPRSPASLPGILNPPTITAPRRKQSPMDKFRFDQESPYPVYAPPPRSSATPPVPINTAPNNIHRLPPPTPDYVTRPLSTTPLLAEEEKSVARKSILKWRGSTTPSPSTSTVEKRTSQTSKPKRPSRLSSSNLRASLSTTDLPPPSPAIPEQYSRLPANRTTVSSDTSVSSGSYKTPPMPPPPLPGHQEALYGYGTGYEAGSLPPSRQSTSTSSARSGDSGDTRPSFDASQFEIVSPKVNVRNLKPRPSF